MPSVGTIALCICALVSSVLTQRDNAFESASSKGFPQPAANPSRQNLMWVGTADEGVMMQLDSSKPIIRIGSNLFTYGGERSAEAGMPCSSSDQCISGCCVALEDKGRNVCGNRGKKGDRCQAVQVKGGNFYGYCPCETNAGSCKNGYCT